MKTLKGRKLIFALFTFAAAMNLCMHMDVQAQNNDGRIQAMDSKRADTPTKELKTMQADENIPWIFGRKTDDNGNITWPQGVSYDSGSNTLTLNNVTIERDWEKHYDDDDSDCSWLGMFIEYDGERDFTIRLLGKNCFKYTNRERSVPAISADYQSSADLLITGGGSLELKDIGMIWTQSYNGDAGNLYIDGVTLISNNEGFASQYSNISIKNATITIDNKYSQDAGWYGGRTFGICTGRTDGNNDDVPDVEKIYEGTLTVENSNIDIKNCTYPLAVNNLKLIGCSLYGGETSLEYMVPPNYASKYADWYEDVERGRRFAYTDGWMRISTKNLNLPKVYGLSLVVGDTDGCYIELPEAAVAGRKVNVDVLRLEKGYRLRLYVNGTEISGTSFVMPAKDTTIRAVCEKITSDAKTAKKQVSKITVSGFSNKIAAGKKMKLTAKVFPSNAANKKVIWKSSNTKVAKVNSSGVVTLNKKSGGKSVTITATAADGSKKKASYKITSMKGIVKKITISGKKTVKAGKTLKLKVKVTASKKANKKLKWTSSNKKYATVNASGKVKTLKAGKGKKVKITAAATDGSGKKAVITVKIK